MALFTCTLTKKNRADFTNTVLLNTDRVVDFRAEGTGTIFYYDYFGGRRDKALELQTAENVQTFRKHILETDVNEFIYIETVANGRNQGNLKTVTRDYELSVDHIVWGEDITSDTYDNYCYLWVRRGHFQTHLFACPFSVTEIAGSESASGSLSRVL